MDDYGTVISFSMVQNLVETDVNEAFDLLNLNLFKHIFLFGVLPSIIVYLLPVKNQSISAELKNRLGVFALLLIVTSTSAYITLKDVAFIGREHRDLRFYVNPLFPVASVYKYFKASIKGKNKPLEIVFNDSRVVSQSINNGKNTVLIVVVGETARASNFNLNGYIKDTTPRLNKLNIINYSNTFSCGTATAESIPCMFSDITHEEFNIDKIRHRENLLDALTYAQIDVLWRENNSGCKGVCNRSETEVMHIVGDERFCKGKECYDDILLNNLDQRIKNLKNDAVIFLHQQGSHGPAYYKRTPEQFKKFMPECNTRSLQDCTQSEITNAYDNSILYTDYILSEVINVLKSNADISNTAMIYMSDHGESLGEGGVYLHGLPYFMAPDEQIKIPFIMWLSSSIKESKGISSTCLSSNSNNEVSHDNLLHSVLGLMDVTTKNYEHSLDLFSACRTDDDHVVKNPAIKNSNNI